MPILAVAGIAAAGGIAQGLIGASAAKDAANIQSQAANNALDFQKQVYAQNQTNVAPYLAAGSNALGTIGRLQGGDYSSFSNSPDYNFALQQGTRGVTNYENAQGMGMSGGALKDIAQFNQGLASQQYGNYFNRLMQIAQLGGNAASGLNSTNSQMSNTIGNTAMGVGQAQASGVVGSANAWNGGISNGINNSLLAAYLGNNPSAFKTNIGNSLFGGGSPSGYGVG